MLTYITRKMPWMLAAVALLLVCLTGGAFADSLDFYLDVQAVTKTLPDGTNVTMWGFGMCDRTGFTNCQPATVPGPALTTRNDGTSRIIAGDNITIHLRNSLPTGGPAYVEPVSVMIPGQILSNNTGPVWTDGTSGPRAGDLSKRVRSMTHETATGAGTAAYTFNAVRAGTYLYESATHPGVQVQMGLYGALAVDSGAGQAYPTVAYASEVFLLFSEIDLALHTAVAAGTYGTPAYPSMNPKDWKSDYFLLNGVPYTSSLPPVFAGTNGSSVLLRVLSASYDERVPTLQGSYMSVVAEDGNPYTYPKERYAYLLPAGKTWDAVVSVDNPKYLPFYDRRMGLSNATGSTGGMLTYLGFAADATTQSVTVTKVGQGTVTSVPGGINCGSACSSGSFSTGVPVSLVAMPAQGSVFSGWSDSCTGAGDCTLAMTSSASVTATFSAVSAVKLLSPNGGEVLPTNSVFQIQWQAPASATKFKLHYSLDNGATWKVIVKNATGTSYNWKVPKVANNITTARVRVTGLTSGGAVVGADASNKPFTIEVVSVTSPNGGEGLVTGNTHTVTWRTNATIKAVKKVVLKYSLNKGRTWKPLATISGFNPGSYDWVVPAVPKVKGNCLVKVVLKDAGNKTVGRDVSDATFTISPTP